MNRFEEYAEEYYYKKYPVTLNIGEEGRKKEVTDIYIAGFKAGRETEREYVKNNAFTSMKRASKTVQSSSTMSNLPKQKKLLKRF